MIRSLLLLTSLGLAKAQFGELASVVTNLLGGAAGPVASGAVEAASGATGALGSIGTLYQLAQTALQLTGTGVGILNQASEGRWFSDLTNNIVSNQRELQDRLLSQGVIPGQLPLTASGLLPSSVSGGNHLRLGKGPNGIDGEDLSGSELGQLGKSFPAPEPEDYEDGKKTEPETLVQINKSALKLPTTLEPEVTLLPEEVQENFENREKEYKISTKKLKKTEEEYYDEAKKELEEEFLIDSEPSTQATKVEEKFLGGPVKENLSFQSKFPKSSQNLPELIKAIQTSGLNETEIAQLIAELSRNQTKEQKENKATLQAITITPLPIRVVSTGRQTTKAQQLKLVNSDGGDDSDLLPVNFEKVNILMNKLKEDATPVSPKNRAVGQSRFRKYPRRTRPPPQSPRHQHVAHPILPVDKSSNSSPLKSIALPPQPPSPQFLQVQGGFTVPTVQPWYTVRNLWTPPTPAPIPNFFNFNKNNPPAVFASQPNVFTAQSPQLARLPTPVAYAAPQNYPSSSAPAHQLPSYYSAPLAQPYTYSQVIRQFQSHPAQAAPRQLTSWLQG